MRKIKFVYWMCLMWVCASTTWAQTVSDSLSVKEPIRSEVSVDTLSLSVSDSLGLSAADTLVLSATDTLNLSDVDTLVTDTAKVGAKVRKRRPELPDWMKPYFVWFMRIAIRRFEYNDLQFANRYIVPIIPILFRMIMF